MRKLISQRYTIRRNLLTILGFCLGLYFSYHACFGERSVWRLMALEKSTARLSKEYDQLHGQRMALEGRVIRMRPGSLDPDMLEERARYVLGYVRADETVIIR